MDYRNGTGPIRGLTLVEMILVVALIAGLMAAISPAVRVVNMGWQAGERRIEVVQNGRVAMDEAVRTLRQARAVSSVSASGDTDGYIEFYDKDNVLQRLDVDSVTGYVQLGPASGQAVLAGPVTALEFSCYDSSNTLLTSPVTAHEIRSVAVDLTTSDAENQVPSYTLRSKVYMRRDGSLVINEIMYNPAATSHDDRYEWIELFNFSDRTIDTEGWEITSWTNRNNPDVLSGDTRFGTGSTLLSVGEYAVIICEDTEVYTELLTNRGFESNPEMSVWSRSSGWSRTNSGDAHEGNRVLERPDAGWVYQTATIQNVGNSAFFSCWEKTPSASATGMSWIITIRDTGGGVLETVYSGAVHTDWTCHYADMTDYMGSTVRVYVETVGAGTFWIDDFSLSRTYVDQNAVRLVVDDGNVCGAQE